MSPKRIWIRKKEIHWTWHFRESTPQADVIFYIVCLFVTLTSLSLLFYESLLGPHPNIITFLSGVFFAAITLPFLMRLLQKSIKRYRDEKDNHL